MLKVIVTMKNSTLSYRLKYLEEIYQDLIYGQSIITKLFVIIITWNKQKIP